MNPTEAGGAEQRERRQRAFPWTLFAAGLAFWPVFLLLVVLEEKAGWSWLQTENRVVWVPISAAALLAVMTAPFFAQRPLSKKILLSLCSALGFAALYGGTILIGVSILNWND